MLNPSAAPVTGRTLRLSWPFGRALLLTVLLLALLAGAAEALARLPAVQGHLVLNSTDNPNPDFDRLLFEYDQHVTQAGAADCLIVGSSLAGEAFSAQAFADAYRQAGVGDAPDCYNFAVPALLARQAGPLARLLVSLYHPRVLIFGTSARDFSPQEALAGHLPANDLTNGAWVKYRLGQGFSLSAWLIDHSRAYRAAVGLRRLVFAPPPSRIPSLTVDLTKPPDPQQESDFYAFLADYYPSPAGLDGLAQIVGLQAQGVQVYVVEMPLHPSYVAGFTHGQADLDGYRAAVQSLATAAGVTFWSAEVELSPALSDADFIDRSHTSASGRLAFSAWLAGKLAGER